MTPLGCTSLYVGIDPGTTGAVAVLHGHRLSVFDVPTVARTKKRKGKKSTTRREMNLPALCQLAGSICSLAPDGVFIERVQGWGGAVARRGETARTQGAASGFAFGKSAGAIECAFVAFGPEPLPVLPAKWKRHFGLIGKDKEASRQLAIQLFPSAKHFFSRKKDVDRAEASLIALYGAQHDPD